MKKTWCSADVAQDAGEIELLLQHRARKSCVNVHIQFLGDDGGERGLAQARRAVEQHVVHRLAAHAGGFDGDREILFELALPGEIGEAARAQSRFELQRLRPARSPEISSRSGMCYQLTVPVPKPRRNSGSNSRARLRPWLCAPRLRPAAARSPDSAAPKARPGRPAKAASAGGAAGSSPVRRRQLVAQFQHHALSGLLADAGNPHQPFHFAAADGSDQIRRRQPGENLHRQRRARCRSRRSASRTAPSRPA